VKTARSVWSLPKKRGIEMPITHGVYLLLDGKIPASEVLKQLMVSPLIQDGPA